MSVAAAGASASSVASGAGSAAAGGSPANAPASIAACSTYAMLRCTPLTALASPRAPLLIAPARRAYTSLAVGSEARAFAASASSTVWPSTPPFSTRSGFVLAKSWTVLATAARSPGVPSALAETNARAVGPVSVSSSMPSSSSATATPHQRVLVDAVLTAGRAHRVAQLGQLRDLEAAVLREEHGVGGRQLLADLLDHSDLRRAGILHLFAPPSFVRRGSG